MFLAACHAGNDAGLIYNFTGLLNNDPSYQVPVYRQAHRQAYRQVYRHAHRHAHRQLHRQVHRR